jgi:hypothetical protein
MQKLSGYLILISFITTLYSYFINNSFLISSSLILWLSALMLFSTLKNKNVVLILIFLSMVFFGISFINGFFIDINKVFSINQYLIVLLIGVGFLRLIVDPKKDSTSNSSKGKSGFLKTYLSLHLFGSMINISALLIMADRLYKKAGKLSNLQVILLTRAFSSDAYWSPFFVAFGVAITYAPKLELIFVSTTGVILAFISFIITYFEVKDRDDLASFEGYPLNLQSLILPFSLAFFVLLIHYFYRDIKIIVLISILAFVLSLVVLPIKDGIKKAINKYKKHINEDLPNMKGEISLFLAAGMFGVSVSSILNGVDFTLPFDHFDYIIASIVLLLFIGLSFIGIHPIITISIFGHMLADFNQSLVAITFLMAWGLTVSTSPFSGQTLTIHARYKVDIKELVKSNFAFILKIYFFCIVLLYVLSEIVGLK